MVDLIEDLIFRIIFVVMYAIFGSTRIYYRRKATKSRSEQSDEPTKTEPIRNWAHIAISISILGMIIAYILYLFIPPWTLCFPLPFPSILRWFGVLLGFCAVPFLIWTHRTLGRWWSAELEIQNEHRIITTGPYARIRHPMYTAFIVFTIGTVLLAANLFVTIFGLLVSILLYPISKTEEQMLLNEFGDQYYDYMKRTGRFVPRIRQLKEAEDDTNQQEDENKHSPKPAKNG